MEKASRRGESEPERRERAGEERARAREREKALTKRRTDKMIDGREEGNKRDRPVTTKVNKAGETKPVSIVRDVGSCSVFGRELRKATMLRGSVFTVGSFPSTYKEGGESAR